MQLLHVRSEGRSFLSSIPCALLTEIQSLIVQNEGDGPVDVSKPQDCDRSPELQHTRTPHTARFRYRNASHCKPP